MLNGLEVGDMVGSVGVSGVAWRWVLVNFGHFCVKMGCPAVSILVIWCQICKFLYKKPTFLVSNRHVRIGCQIGRF